MRILVSAMSCSPIAGSEGLLGWQACQSLSRLGEVWVVVNAEHQPAIEQAQQRGMLPANIHFTFLGRHRPYSQNRLLARLDGWRRYVKFSRATLPAARQLHAAHKFDLAHHVTSSTWRVGCPLWRLGIPLIWGPISGTEIFPLRNFGSILSPSAKAFEWARILSGAYSQWHPEVRRCARKAFHILAAHDEAVEHLAKLRGTRQGISVLSYFSFGAEPIRSLARPAFQINTGAPLKIIAGGNLEGRKGVAIALEGLALARQRGVRFSYRVTGKGSEQEHLEGLARRLGLEGDVRIGDPLAHKDYIRELKESDLYLLPSLREGGGATMMEAMLAGCVPIVARCGGPGTAVTDECGVRVPVISPRQMAEEIATAVIRLDQDRALLCRMGAAAARRVAENYSEERFSAVVQGIYEEALASAYLQ